MLEQNFLNTSSLPKETDNLSVEPSQSVESENQNSKLDEVTDLSSASTANLLTKKRRPVRQRIESGQWRRKQMIGSSLRFQFFDELVEGDKPLELIICRLCDSAYSIHSRSHCLEHIKQRHPEVISENIVNSSKLNEEKNDLNDNNFSSNNVSNQSALMMINELGCSRSDQHWPNLNSSHNDLFNSQPNPIATPLVKRRRLITTEMAKCRLQSGEWQLRSVTGASVRCRFFYEIYEGDSPLNTLSCKLCGATYSTQSRSHYREHVRRRHSEVYCVRSGRVSNNTSFDNQNIQNFNEINNYLSSKNTLNTQNVEDDENFSLNLKNVGLKAESTIDSPLNSNLVGTNEINSKLLNSIGNSPAVNNNNINTSGNSTALKMRRIITTETVINHLKAGDWSRKPIPGMSIRSRFFDEIVDGDSPLNILICKLCGSTYSAQSRSHCVEHVKKRHLSILEGNEDAEDFEIEAWRETRKINSTNQSQQQFQSLNKLPYDKNISPFSNLSNKNSNFSSHSNSQISQRRRKPVFSTVGPDQTFETPSIDSILQSLASQALFQENNDEFKVEEDFMEPDDYKFDLSTLNSIINGGATSSSAIRKRNCVNEDNEFSNLKRKNIDNANLSITECPSTSPQISGGINDQLIALSNLANFESDNDNLNKNGESNSKNFKTKLNESLNMNYNQEGLNSIENNEAVKKSSNNSNSNIVNNKQNLNHQQLSIAAQTTALLSSNNDSSTNINKSQASSSNIQKKSNFFQNNESLNDYIRSNYNALLSNNNFSQFDYDLSNNYNESNHPSFNSYDASFDANNDYFQSNVQHQHYHELRQRHFFEYQQLQKQQNLINQFNQSQQNLNYNHKLNLHKLNNFSPSVSSNSGSVPAGLLPPSFLNSRVKNHNFLKFDKNSTNENLSNSSLNLNKAQFSSNLTESNSDEFCKSCKSEFPNVLRELNQLYDRVNDLINVMYSALDNLNTKEPDKKNIKNALEKLVTVAASGATTVNNFSSSVIAQKTVADVIENFPLDEFSDLEPNGIVNNCQENDDELYDTECSDNKCEDNVQFDENKKKNLSNLLLENNENNLQITVNDNTNEKNDVHNYNECVNLEGPSVESNDLITNNIEKNEVSSKLLITLDDNQNDEDSSSENNKIKENLEQTTSDSNSTASCNIRDVYLSILEKEILKASIDEFNLESLSSVNNIVKKSRPEKVLSALEHLTLRGLLNNISVDKDGQKTFKKITEKIDQLNL